MKNWKFWQTPTSIKFNIFRWNLACVTYLEISTKVCLRTFSFCLDLELLIKCKKWVCRNQTFFIFAIKSNLWWFELVKVFNFLYKKPAFLKTIELCLIFCRNFLRLLLLIVKLKSPIKIFLSYWQDNWPNVFEKWSIKYFSFWGGGLYIPTHSHL